MLHWKKIVPIVLTFCLVLSLTTTANARTALTFGHDGRGHVHLCSWCGAGSGMEQSPAGVYCNAATYAGHGTGVPAFEGR